MNELGKIKYFLLDMDGTIYLGDRLFPGTLPFLAKLKAQGKRAFYLTNNSSKSVSAYVEKLAAMGIEADSSSFFTSAQALAYKLNQVSPGCKIFLLGTPSMEEYMESQGFSLVKDYETDPGLRPEYVVLAFDTTLTYQKLTDACHYICEGVSYWATHPDIVCPFTEDFSIPDAGAMMECIKAATGGKVPEFIAGKPYPYMINMFMDEYGVSPEEVAVVGDRLYTDIRSGINAGVTSICLLSGETSAEDIEASDFKPDYVLKDIQELCDCI